MRTFAKLALYISVILGATGIATAGSLKYTSASTVGHYNQWDVTVPAGTVVHSYVVAQSGGAWTAGYQFTDQSWTYVIVSGLQVNVYRSSDTGTGATWSGDPLSGTASMQAGIAGPPAGVVCVAATTVGGFYQSGTDEKWATLVGGNYQIWHGGSSSSGGLITASTELNW